jgi:hypothetical protein
VTTSSLFCSSSETSICQQGQAQLCAVKLHPAQRPAYHSEGDHAATHWCGGRCNPRGLHGHNAAPGRESVMGIRGRAKVSPCLLEPSIHVPKTIEPIIKLEDVRDAAIRQSPSKPD